MSDLQDFKSTGKWDWGDCSQWLRTLAALSGDPGSSPPHSLPWLTNKPLSTPVLRSYALFWPSQVLHACGASPHMQET